MASFFKQIVDAGKSIADSAAQQSGGQSLDVTDIFKDSFAKMSKPCDIIDCNAAIDNIYTTVQPNIKKKLEKPCEIIDCNSMVDNIISSLKNNKQLKNAMSKPCDVIDCNVMFNNVSTAIEPNIKSKLIDIKKQIDPEVKQIKKTALIISLSMTSVILILWLILFLTCRKKC